MRPPRHLGPPERPALRGCAPGRGSDPGAPTLLTPVGSIDEAPGPMAETGQHPEKQREAMHPIRGPTLRKLRFWLAGGRKALQCPITLKSTRAGTRLPKQTQTAPSAVAARVAGGKWQKLTLVTEAGRDLWEDRQASSGTQGGWGSAGAAGSGEHNHAPGTRRHPSSAPLRGRTAPPRAMAAAFREARHHHGSEPPITQPRALLLEVTAEDTATTARPQGHRARSPHQWLCRDPPSDATPDTRHPHEL
ncbi:unnamed protein product [Rangifer tarandus platyrhynchus]|uniref:Uncharacterized protein n=1 Tax=Rangifer tarandus platyrhynchus TaxID=3082113 RepID=A0ABN8ZKH7_RANTA|nr:unnamed protein product [Rangifer tarandus platyrhynchus]